MKKIELKTKKSLISPGFTLISREIPGSGVVCSALWVQMGSIYEPKEQAGISHVIEHMLFKGTRQRGVGQIAREVHALGGYLNGFTSWEHTCYWMVLPGRFLKNGLKIQADAFLNPVFDSVELKKERKVILEEIRMGKDQPEHFCVEKLLENAFSRHPYRIPIIGFPRTVSRISRKDLYDFHKKYYSKDNLFLVIAGEIKSEKVKSLVEKIFLRLPKKAGAKPAGISPERAQKKFKTKTYRGDIAGANLLLGFHIPELFSPEFYALELLSALLGEGRTSRLSVKLREKQKLVFKISASTITSAYPGLLVIEATLPPAGLEKAKASIFQEIEKLKTGISQKELEKAKNFLESQYIFYRETCEGQAKVLGYYHSLGDLQKAEEYLPALRKTSRDEVIKAAEKYLKAQNCTQVNYLPSSPSSPPPNSR